MKVRITFHFLVLLFLFLCGASAQEAGSARNGEAQDQTQKETAPAILPAAYAPNPVVQEKHPRLFGVVPTYTVSNSKLPNYLSSSQKFQLFFKNTTDPFTLAYTAASAGIAQASNDPPEYGQGATGYGRRLGAGLADVTSSGFFRTYLFPSILHEDPRYFRQGSSPFTKRFAHAIIRPVVTQTDSGKRRFNWSGVLGLIATCSLSNAYYPASARGVDRTFNRVATGIPFSAIDHLIDEFGPDLERKFLGREF